MSNSLRRKAAILLSVTGISKPATGIYDASRDFEAFSNIITEFFFRQEKKLCNAICDFKTVCLFFQQKLLFRLLLPVCQQVHLL
jgi:hypothetical protein